MKNTTPFLPELHLQSLRKKPRSSARKMDDEIRRKNSKSLLGLEACFGRFIPKDMLQKKGLPPNLWVKSVNTPGI